MHNINITSQIITFEQLSQGSYTLGSDVYEIATNILTPNRIAIGLNCPFNSSKDNCAFYFVNVDDIPASRAQYFGTQLYADGHIYPSGTGSSLETAEEYRHLGIGADVMLFPITNDEYDTFIAAGISDIALPLYKKLRYHLFEYPRIMQLRHSRCIVESKGLQGGLLRCISTLADCFLKPIVAYSQLKGKRLLRKFQVTKVDFVPNWVDDIVLNDGHKYMEAHTYKWLQWNLDYQMSNYPQNISSFYTIYKDNQPIGFFMTKERFRPIAGGTLKNIVLGAIIEWGTKYPSLLSEEDIYNIALTTFTKQVDIVETATDDYNVVKAMKKKFFIPHGYAHIVFKDKKKLFTDAGDINLWRIRYGYADVILT